jgi:DNA-directed RNA polymerase subunit RPC12/RpoP
MPSTPSRPGSDANTELQSPKRERVLTAVLQCHLCAETCGVLESPASRGLTPVARFTSADGSLSQLVAWQRLRCPRCSSRSLFVGELEIVTRRTEAPVEMDPEPPRRGRPPRWLVELRARQAVA